MIFQVLDEGCSDKGQRLKTQALYPRKLIFAVLTPTNELNLWLSRIN